MRRLGFLGLFLLCVVFSAASQRPAWVDTLPFTEDAYWGVGEASSLSGAEARAKRDILLQLNTRVQAAVTERRGGGRGAGEVTETLDAYFGSNTLRGAEVEDTYQEGDRYWVLMRYGDECGDMLMHSAVTRYEDELGYERDEVLEELFDPRLDVAIREARRRREAAAQRPEPEPAPAPEPAPQPAPAPEPEPEREPAPRIEEAKRVERTLQDLDLEDYRSQDISVFLSDGNLILRVVNFLPSRTNLTDTQRDGLRLLSNTLFEELEALDYSRIRVIGHANPTGIPNEEAELDRLSIRRARTMASFLRYAGLEVSSVTGRGGEETIGDVNTEEGKGRNRRVEVVVEFDE